MAYALRIISLIDTARSGVVTRLSIEGETLTNSGISSILQGRQPASRRVFVEGSYASIKSRRQKSLPVFSFFSGAGFLDLGFEAAGFDTVFVNEFNAEFLHGYKFARTRLAIPAPEFGWHNGCIEEFIGSARRRLQRKVEVARARGPVGFIGGPPCPDFSVGGKNRGQDGENGRLTARYFELVKLLKPDWFLFENVKGLYKTKSHRAFYDGQKQLLMKAGYALTERLINSIEYGVAQNRERVILIGFSKNIANEIGARPGEEFNDCSPWLSAITFTKADVLCPLFASTPERTRAQLPQELTVDYWFRRNRVDVHPNAQHIFKPRAGLARFLTIKEGDDSRKSFKRLDRYKYSPTACYGNNEVHIHPTEPRRISVAEALAIQSLPSDFELPGDMTLTAMFKTVGNGVPFLAARGLAATVRAYLARANL